MNSYPWYDEYAHCFQPPTLLNWLPPLDGSHLTEMAPPSPEGPKQRPMPNYIQVAKPYLFQQQIDHCLKETGVSQAREDNVKLAGVQWIDNVRRALKLPVRTFDMAVTYYHKFRLVHADGEYSYVDAAGAALFTACKIEDTLKKSRDILCAAYNLKVPPSEQLSPDDPFFESHSRSIIGLERLMLEASSFDFRGRHPQDFLIKLAKYYKYTKESAIVATAYSISLDLYRTFAPLKQTTATLAFACLELAGRLHNERNEAVESRDYYKLYCISRETVMETLLDLLELYTHYRTSTFIGPDFTVDAFLQVRIPLNEERLPRYTESIEHEPPLDQPPSRPTNGRAPSHPTMNGKPSPISPRENLSPATSGSNGTPGGGKVRVVRAAAAAPTTRIGERGREGTVRFMLNPDRERHEREIVKAFLED